ncbi:thioredoxin domain-containing protein 5-like [Dendronephthya gigantea]|uniref:thioredoxin domain-containing protein 5-like n=1 Tax=Dendronephthya gigantea TaxID=151771 RepID=UPI00106A7B51|nr:thioredoxin domain-containing protein 5-like [Dendronephthya gigantea]
MKKIVTFVTLLVAHNISNAQNSADFLNVETFAQVIQPQFVLFYAPWCSHCKQLLPTWNELADKSRNQNKWNKMKISKVNCIEETAFCSDQNIVAYPTMKLFHKGDMRRYDGRRSLGQLEIFIDNVLNNKINILEEEGLLTLTNENFDVHIKQGDGLHFVDFYAPWCIHCKQFEPTWKAIAKHYQNNPDITIGKVDCTIETSKCRKWGVDSFPTLTMFQDGKKLDTYKGSRDIEAVKSYINNMLYQHNIKDNMKESVETPSALNTEEDVYLQSDDQDAINSNPVVQVIDRTFDMLVNQETVFINFYVPWSKESKALQEIWNNLGMLSQREALATIAQIDCSKFSEVCKKQQISQYPTLILFKDGNKHYYDEEKTLNSLYNFVKQYMHDEL